MGAYTLGFISGVLFCLVLVEIISILASLFMKDIDDTPLYKNNY